MDATGEGDVRAAASGPSDEAPHPPAPVAAAEEHAEIGVLEVAASAVAVTGRPSVVDLKTAQAALERVFTLLGITQVICVDDAHAVDDDARDLVIAAVDGGELDLTGPPYSELPKVAGLIRYSQGQLKPATEAADALRTSWTELPEPTRAALAQGARARSARTSLGQTSEEVEAESDASAESQLASLIGTACQYHPLTLKTWRSRGRTLLTVDQRSVVLFDRDFSHEDGGGERDGDQELKALVAEGRVDVWCGLLTHTVTRENEVEEWRRLVTELGVPASHFLVISKRRLLDEPDSLARMLRLTIVAPGLDQLRGRVVEARAEAHREAAERLVGMDVYTIEAAVFQSADEEGTWEPDMLLGLAAALEEDRARALVRDSPEILEICDRLREARLVDLPPAIPDSDVAMLLRLQIYESAAHVNGLRLPIAPGDTFRMTSLDQGREAPAPRYYVLLGQACDLAVRSDGKRAHEPTHLELAEIRLEEGPRTSPSLETQDLPVEGDAETALPIFDEGDHRYGVVLLGRTRLLPSIAVDACVFNKDGGSLLAEHLAASSSLSNGWRKRHARLFSKAQALLQHVEEWSARKITETDVTRLCHEEVGIIRGSQLSVQIDASSRSVQFGLMRTGRLREPWARRVTMAGAQRRTRVAFDPFFVPKRYRT